MEGAPLNQFDFYLRFAKPLVLNLAEPNERVLAAAWLQKLRNPDSGDEQLRTDYLKLLLFVLQRKRLAGPFTQNPGQYEKLEQFPEQYKLQDVAKAVKEVEEEDRRKKAAQGKAGASGDFPPYTTEYSADLLEYTAAQDIPNFGVHVYYAISKDPLPLWDNADKGVFPRTLSAGKIDLMRSSSAAPSISTLSGFGARARSKSRSRSRSRSRTGTPKRRTSRGRTPPTSPLGVPPPPEERLPPTWGTNLIQVSEPPKFPGMQMGFLEESFPDYEEPLSGELSGDLRFKGPSPQPYVSPFDISAYEPRPYTARAVRRLDFDEDRTRIQLQPGMPIEIQGQDAEGVTRITEMLERDRQRTLITPMVRGPVTDVVAPPAPKKITKKTSLTMKKIKPAKPVPKGTAVAKPPLFPPKPAPKYKAPLPKKKISKTTVKKTTTKGGKTTVEETVTTVEKPTKPVKKKAQIPQPKPKIPTPPLYAAAATEEEFLDYDMEELKKLGLTEADLIDIDLGDLDELQVEDISDQEVEEMSGVDLYDEQMMKQLDEYDRRIKELEDEFADDIAMFGDQVGTSPIPGIADEISPSGAPSLPYKTPPVSPGFIASPYDDTLYATGMPSYVESSMTEQQQYDQLPLLLQPLQYVDVLDEDIAEAQFVQAAPAQVEQEDLDYIEAWLSTFKREEEAAAAIAAASAMRAKSSSVKQKGLKTPGVRPKTPGVRHKTPGRVPGAPKQPIRTPQFPPMTPSKGAVKKVITKKTSKTKGGIKSVVESTTTISQPVPPEGQVPAASSKLGIPGTTGLLVPGTRIPLPGSALPTVSSKISVPPGSKLPILPSRIARPAGSKLPQPGKTIKKTTVTTSRVVEPQPPLPDFADLSAASLPYRTPPLPYSVYETDEELEEYKLLEAEILEGVSESQRQLEQLETEAKRRQWLQSEGQSRATVDAVLNQMEALYSIQRGPTARPLPGQVYDADESDEELAEYRAIEEDVLAGLSESQRQREILEAERRRNEMMQIEKFGRDTTKEVLNQMEALYEGSRMPVRESWAYSPLSEAPSLPYRTPPLPTKTQGEVAATKTTTRKVVKTKGGVTTVKESKTIEKPKVSSTASKIGIPKRAIPAPGQRVQSKPSAAVSGKPGVKRVKPDTRQKKIAPGTPAAQAIIDEANQQMYRLDQLYKKYQLPGRRPDVERTPPVFSKYREIRQAGAGITYPPEQFGLTEQELFQPGTEYFKDRKEFSPYVDHRRPVGEVLPGLSTFPEPSDWLLAEERPDEEILETVVTPTKHSPKQEMEEIMRDIEVSPTWAGLPVTTPKRSPSPRRTALGSVSPIMFESPEEKGIAVGKFGVPMVHREKPKPQYVPQLVTKKPESMSPSSLIDAKPKQVTTKQTYTTTTTEKALSSEDGEPVTILEESISTSVVDEPAKSLPSTPSVADYGGTEQDFAGVYSDLYQSPTDVQYSPPKRTPTLSAQEAAGLTEVEEMLIPSSPELVSPQFPDVGGMEIIDDMDMYELPTSPQEDTALRSEQIEITETEIVEETEIQAVTEQQRISPDLVDKQKAPYIMAGTTSGKAYPLKEALVEKPVLLPLEEEMEVEEDEEVLDEPVVYITTTEETEVIEQIEPDLLEISPQLPYSPVTSPLQFGTATDVQLEEEFRPADYYHSPRKLTPPPPKSPLPEMDPFLVDVAYAEYPEMRKMRPVKRKPRVSPVMEELEVEPESPTAPPIYTTPRRPRTPSPLQPISASGTPIRRTRSKRVLKRRLIDFSQPEPGTEDQHRLHVPEAAVLEGLPIPVSQPADYPYNLMGMEMPESYETYPREPSPVPFSLPEPMQPQAVKKRLPEWQSPEVNLPGRLDLPKPHIQIPRSPIPVIKHDEYVSVATMEPPQEIYSPTAQHGHTVPLEMESPEFVVEEEITEETVEELPAPTVAEHRTPPTFWPTPPPEYPSDEHTQRDKEIQLLAQQQYESLWTPSPHTPPKQETVWDRQDVEVLEAEVPEELVSPGSPPTPFSTAEAMQEMLDTLRGKKYVEPRGRRPVALYGYGERTEKVIERKSKPPGLATVPDDRIEPQDDYVYWPGPYQPVSFTPLRKVLSPNPLHPGHSRSPLYANLPPESAKRRDVLAPSPTKGRIMVKIPPRGESPIRPIVPPVLLAEGAITETPVSRFASRDRRRRRLEPEVSPTSPKHELHTTTEGELDPLKNIMDAVAGQLAALYTPPPPPIKTPDGPRGKRMKQMRKRLFTDMGEIDAEAAPTADVLQYIPQSSEIVETVETQEVIEIPKEYSTYKLEVSPRMRHIPDIVDELEYDVEPAEVYYIRDPQVSPAKRPEIRALTPPPQPPPETSPRMTYEFTDERNVGMYEEDFYEPESPVLYPPSPSEELPSPFISYTPTQSPPGVDPRLKEKLMMHEYTSGFERDERPYQRPFVRVGSRSQYYMGGRLPPQGLAMVEEEQETWPTMATSEAPMPTGTPRRLQPTPRVPRPPSPELRPKTPSPRIPTPPPLPVKEAFAKQWKSPGKPQRSPVIGVPVTDEGMQQLTPPHLYAEAEEDVGEEDVEFIRVETEESVISIVTDSPELAPEPGYYYESPTTERVPSPYLSYTPPLPRPSARRPRSPSPQMVYSEGVPKAVQGKSPVWPQLDMEVPSSHPTVKQMTAAPSRLVQQVEVERRKNLQFDTFKPPLSPPTSPAVQRKIGKWITPPPSSSKATPPILQKRPQYVSPPSKAVLDSLYTPPQRMESPQRPRARTSPMPPPTTPWLPPVPSVEMEVIESTTTVIESDYEVREPFGGSRSPGIYDTSPIRLDLERSFIEDELKGFKWMDQ